MLPEQYRQLLTAYVDGELSGRQRRHVVRLLKRSPDGRELAPPAPARRRRRQRPDRAASSIIDLSAPVLRTFASAAVTVPAQVASPVAPAYPGLGRSRGRGLCPLRHRLCFLSGFCRSLRQTGEQIERRSAMVKKPDQLEQPFDVTSVRSRRAT